MTVSDVTVVIPTVGRESLRRLVESIAASDGPRPLEAVVVDDRPAGAADLPALRCGAVPVRVLRSGGRGPAAARNRGWRAATTPWIAFLDDDVEVSADWLAALHDDLAGLPATAASQGRIEVPPPTDGRRPTDWERGTAGLAHAQWITADMAYRRNVLAEVHGFDERFPRAYREDADLALRVRARGYRIAGGRRRTVHPVRPAGWWVSVRQQRGNRDDALMRSLHGRGWRTAAGAPRGRRWVHAAVTGAALTASLGAASGRRGLAWAAGGAWAVGTARFAWQRIAPGPRTPAEVARMVTTSVAIPPVAVWYGVRGLLAHRRAPSWPTGSVSGPAGGVAAVLVDRDGTLVHDVPYNGDPALVRPVDGARTAVQRLRAAGLPVAVITNQSGVARGLLTPEQVAAVNARVDELLGPFDDWQVCPHGAADGCGCRKPAPGMVLRAADRLGVPAERCVVIGDIGADVQAAQAAGATGLLVPTPTTRRVEIDAAPAVFPDLSAAVDAVLTSRAGG